MGAGVDYGVFYFHSLPDAAVVADQSIAPYVCVGADPAISADDGIALYVNSGQYDGVFAQHQEPICVGAC